MEHKLRFTWNSNSMWSPSGYANQTRQILPLASKEGYKVAAINFYGQEGGMFALDGIMQYPKISDPYGSDALIEHSKRWKSDVAFTLQDIWTISPDTFKNLMSLGIRWIPYVPIDHEPIPQPILDRLRLAYRIVTMSPFGYEELKRVGIHSTMIPHMVNTEAFKRCDDRVALRKDAKLPENKFIFGMVAANKDNPPRKSIDKVIDAFKIFHDKHPDSALYFHSLLKQAGGFDIDNYVRFLGLQDSVFNTDPYEMLYSIQQEDMWRIYNIMDCLLIPSQNEGFGIPIIEAQACEVPVITTDFTAMRDLVIDEVTGFKVPVKSKRFTPLNSYVADVRVEDILEKMEKVYAMTPKDRHTMGKRGRDFIEKNYSQRVVWETKWKPFLQTVEYEVYDKFDNATK